MFLDGLDSSYVIATRQIRQQLRAWPEDEVDIPQALRLNALPRTIETMLQEDTDTPTVRATQVRSNHPLSTRPKESNTTNTRLLPTNEYTKRAYVDVQCQNCGAFGHKPINCDKLAQHLLLQEAAAKINEKIRAKLLHNYNKVMKDRRDR